MEHALGRAQKSTSKFGKAAKIGIGAALTGIGVAAVGMGVMVKRGFDEFSESQKVMAQTKAVLKSTGGEANVTAGKVEKLAGSLSDLSGVDDELIAAGENVLLTFTNIRNEAGKGNKIFDQATKRALDLSTALGTDLKGANILVGKALNDPVRGLTALRRVGVSFTKGQEETIKRLVESGDVMGAQKVILRELNKEFGGSAKAAGSTLPGQLSKLGNKFDELSGKVVAGLVPALTSIVDWTNKHWPQIEAVITGVFGAIAAAVTTTVGFFRTHWPQIQMVVDEVVGRVREALQGLQEYWDGSLKPAIQNIIDFSKALWAKFGDDIKRNLAFAIAFVRNGLQLIKGIVDLVLAVIRGDWSEAWDALKGIVRNALQGVVMLLRNMLSNVVSAARKIGAGIKDAILAGLSGLAGLLGSAIRGAINAVISAIRAFGIPGFKIDPPGPGSFSFPGVHPFSGVPYLASGGDITRTGMAVVHRGETVTPARVARGGGSSGDLRFMFLTNDEGARFLQRLNQKHARGNGGRPIW